MVSYTKAAETLLFLWFQRYYYLADGVSCVLGTLSSKYLEMLGATNKYSIIGL